MAANEPDDDVIQGDDPERLKTALKIAAANIARLNDQRAKLCSTLEQALVLIDNLIADMRHKGVSPSPPVIVIKATLDQRMRVLIGDLTGATTKSILEKPQ